jgi:hypothetical protein
MSKFMPNKIIKVLPLNEYDIEAQLEKETEEETD